MYPRLWQGQPPRRNCTSDCFVPRSKCASQKWCWRPTFRQRDKIIAALQQAKSKEAGFWILYLLGLSLVSVTEFSSSQTIRFSVTDTASELLLGTIVRFSVRTEKRSVTFAPEPHLCSFSFFSFRFWKKYKLKVLWSTWNQIGEPGHIRGEYAQASCFLWPDSSHGVRRHDAHPAFLDISVFFASLYLESKAISMLDRDQWGSFTWCSALVDTEKRWRLQGHFGLVISETNAVWWHLWSGRCVNTVTFLRFSVHGETPAVLRYLQPACVYRMYLGWHYLWVADWLSLQVCVCQWRQHCTTFCHQPTSQLPCLYLECTDPAVTVVCLPLPQTSHEATC